MYQDLILSLESSADVDPVTLLTDGEISDELKDTLDTARIPYIVNADTPLGKHVKVNEGRKINAVHDGVYVPELDDTRGIGKKVRVITTESLNVDADADAYLVDDDSIAESLESTGRVVLRDVDELNMWIRQ